MSLKMYHSRERVNFLMNNLTLKFLCRLPAKKNCDNAINIYFQQSIAAVSLIVLVF